MNDATRLAVKISPSFARRENRAAAIFQAISHLFSLKIILAHLRSGPAWKIHRAIGQMEISSGFR
jgi:hypothetical protein